MQYETCRHIKEDGAYCGCPALRDRKYCYYHLMQRGRRLRRALAIRRGEPRILRALPLDNLRAIQIALTEVFEGISSGRLEHRAAGLMLYTLQQATTVAKRVSDLETQLADAPSDAVTDDPNRVQELPDFEAQLDLPAGVDLDGDPEVALEAALLAEVTRAVSRPVPQPAAAVANGRPAPPTRDLDRVLEEARERARAKKEEERKKKPVTSVMPQLEEQTGSA